MKGKKYSAAKVMEFSICLRWNVLLHHQRIITYILRSLHIPLGFFRKTCLLFLLPAIPTLHTLPSLPSPLSSALLYVAVSVLPLGGTLRRDDFVWLDASEFPRQLSELRR